MPESRLPEASPANDDRPAGVAVYVHWPYCRRICPYCDFNVVRDRAQAEQADLVEAILDDLHLQADRLGPRPLAAIFFGGGTPSRMPPQAVARILAAARARFPSDSPVEAALEANPDEASRQQLAALADAGIERLSLGLQALQDDALAFLGRDHDAAAGRRALADALSLFPRVSLDLIYARPGQTPAAWRDELSRAVDLGAGHISPYQLTVEPGTAFGRAHARGRLVPPDDERAADLYEVTQAVLEAAGFEAYEVSNHARTVADRSRHNLHVWRGGDYLGLGPGAHGRLTLDGTRRATVAHRRVADYIAGVAVGAPSATIEPLAPREALEERVLLGLRTVEGVGLPVLAGLGLSPGAGPLAELLADGFLTLADRRLVATARGRPVLDALLARLLT